MRRRDALSPRRTQAPSRGAASAVIAAVVLAAGSSTRMGQPKLLLPLAGTSLLRRVVEEAVASDAGDTVVVTGAYRDAVERELAGLAVRLVHNPDHARGMSTSLRAGLAALRPETAAALVLLADQPLVDRGIVNALIEVYSRTGARIVQPRYGGEPGHPIVWDRALFGELMAQDGDRGGRDILRRRAGEIAWHELPDAHIRLDVDTPDDYQSLRRAFDPEESPRPAHGHHEDGGAGLGRARFCPSCGGALEERPVEGRSRPVCVECSSVLWHDPKVAVATLIPWRDGVLLGRRAIDPGAGRWSFPSGYVDRGEDVEEAARREVREETGLDVEIAGLVGVYSTAGNPVILIVYAAEVVGGEAHAGPEVSALDGFPVDRLPEMAFEHDDRIVRDWLVMQARRERRG